MLYKISEKANEDINSIWLYTFENWSKEQADRYYNLILDEIEFISLNTDSGKSMGHIRKGYFSTKVKSHIIFYRKKNYHTIEIIRILHQRMDIDYRLNE